jgi:hypothetical protein
MSQKVFWSKFQLDEGRDIFYKNPTDLLTIKKTWLGE